MPELPEVEVVATALDAALRGAKVKGAVACGRCRRPFAAADAVLALAGKTVTGVRRRAKYIIIDFNAPAALLCHLGMTGSFRLEKTGAPAGKHDRAALLLQGGRELRFADIRRFGFMQFVPLAAPGDTPAELSRLGPEPLSRAFSALIMLSRAAGRKTPVKTFIMDQHVVVGVGNIYASEALFAAGIHPACPAGELTPAAWARLVAAIKRLLRQSIRRGGSTIRNYAGLDGREGAFQRSLNVYGRAGEPCPQCGAAIATLRQSGRSTFFCPVCQRAAGQNPSSDQGLNWPAVSRRCPQRIPDSICKDSNAETAGQFSPTPEGFCPVAQREHSPALAE